MKTKVDTRLDQFHPPLAKSFPLAAPALPNPAPKLLKASPNLMASSHHQMTQNPSTFSLTFEYLQAIGLKIDTELKSCEYPTDSDRTHGIIKSSSNLCTAKIGEIIAEIKTQVFSAQFTEKKHQPHQIPEAILVLDLEGIEKLSIRQDVAEWIAENPYLAANIISVLATFTEAHNAGLEGAAINTIINLLSSSIKTIAAYCRGELEVKETELIEIIEIIIAGLKIGFLKGVAIKIIQKLMDGSAFAALGFTVSIEVIPTFIKVLKDEINLDQALKEVDPRMFTSAVITTVVILFPTLGTRLLSAAVIKAIWEEISPEWRTYITKNGETARFDNRH
ncbi:MAG: hypothetical protein AAFO04_08555 [Cyanobacteria bacterium J06592_8]